MNSKIEDIRCWLSYGFSLGGYLNGGLVCLIATYVVGNLTYYIATLLYS